MMESVHSLSLELFYLTEDRGVLQVFEDVLEKWYDGDFSYSNAQSLYNQLNHELKKVRKVDGQE